MLVYAVFLCLGGKKENKKPLVSLVTTTYTKYNESTNETIPRTISKEVKGAI